MLMRRWRSMESAPHKKIVILYVGNLVVTGIEDGYKNSDGIYEKDWYSYINSSTINKVSPTHWMPLPDGPGAS